MGRREKVMEEYDFEDFRKEKLRQYTANIANIFAQELLPKKKKESGTEYRKAVREYRKTEEFREKLKERLSDDPTYKLLASPEKAAGNRDLKHEFRLKQQYDRKMKAQKERMENTNRAILERIPENPVDLFPNARKLKRKFVLHIGPTNSGKTHDALEALKYAETGVYLGPLRLLAFEAYEELNKSGVPCSLITGEEEFIVDNAGHVASTVEILDTEQPYDLAVIDEAQMIGDKERGWAWTAALLGVCAEEIHVCLAPEAENIIEKIIRLCDDDFTVVRHERMTPLKRDASPFSFPNSVREHDALIVFSKRDVIRCAAELQRRKMPCSIIYGALPYEVRQNEVRKFADGETKVVVATDAIGMGMNLPVERIVFLKNEKFDGTDKRELNASEIKQIAGRAGRRGMYDEGLYTFASKSRKMDRIMQENVPDVSEVPIGFPEYLLEMDEPLSEIMKCWIGMGDYGVFKKSDMEIQLKLCRELEQETKDKKLIYDFITIPFDERNMEIRGIWKEMFENEKRGEHADFEAPEYGKNDIDSMERAYKICDLYFYYLKKFTDGSELGFVTEYRKRITDDMTAYLRKQKLPIRKCRICGKELPWNSEYSICERCYSRRYRYYYNEW